MKHIKLNIIIFSILLCISALQSATAQIAPLFQDKEPIRITLVTDVLALERDKSESPEYISGMLLHHLSDYKFDAFDLKVKARGNTRRVSGLCDFPPLKFNFKKNQLKNTIFDGVDKLKFVSQCRQEEGFREYLLEEYLLYNTYNIVTENSYRTRLVTIEIKDFQLRVPSISMTGFFIEDEKSLAKRIGAKEFEERVYRQDSCDNEAVDILSMFQFMIGNTDWYINTRHNIDVYERKDDKALIPVAFDFDFAGVINTPYALPSKQIPISKVTQRYYKGNCHDPEAYNPVIDLFNSKKEDIYSMYNSFELLPSASIKKSLKFYNKFYKIINDPALAESSFDSACKGPYIPKNISIK
jgi:hypothetical protein